MLKTLATAALLVLSPLSAHAQNAASYLTDGNGGYLLDDAGGRLFLAGNVHTVTQLSTWGVAPNLIEIDMILDVLNDLSGVRIIARAVNGSAAVQSVSIYTVVNGRGRLLKQCPTNVCQHDWLVSDMVPGLNEIEPLFTDATGTGRGTSTKISRP